MTKQPKPEPTPEKTVPVHFQCPEFIRDEIKRIAIEQDRTLGRQVVRVLREWLANRYGKVEWSSTDG